MTSVINLMKKPLTSIINLSKYRMKTTQKLPELNESLVLMSETKPFSVFDPEEYHQDLVSLSDNILFKTASEFSHFVEMAAMKEDKTCTAIILDYCDMKDIEPEDIAKLISPSLKGKLEQEMIDAGLLGEHSTLEDF